MYDLNEIPVGDTASVLGIPTFTVYWRLRKARRDGGRRPAIDGGEDRNRIIMISPMMTVAAPREQAISNRQRR